MTAPSRRFSPQQKLFYVLLLCALGLTLWQHEGLPERVAAHFDAQGNPNGWLSRPAHTALQIGALLFMTAVVHGLAIFVPRIPKDFINIPNRDYWLAPARAAETHAVLAGFAFLIGCAVLFLLTALFYFIYRANLQPEPTLSLNSWWLTGGSIGFIFAACGWLVVRFSRKPSR
jgi:cytochrome bd-type quinol oxidase subunit 1